MLDKITIERMAGDFLESSPLNRVPEEVALEPRLTGLRIYEKVIMAVASADDPLFAEFTNTPEAGVSFQPQIWVPGAKSIISFFLPFTEEVRKSNAAYGKEPSPEWLHARIEGQKFLDALSNHIVGEIELGGHFAVAPSVDFRFDQKDSVDKNGEVRYSTNWSERHLAYIAGHGTFGLSKGLITKSGMAGRLTSVISTLELPPTRRDYTQLFEYCTNCLACAKNCPADAITKSGKSNAPCRAYIRDIRERYAKDYGYGCGKCQVGVPCETRAPGA